MNGGLCHLCVVSVMKMTFYWKIAIVILTWVRHWNQGWYRSGRCHWCNCRTIKVVDEWRAPLTYGVEEVQLNGSNCIINSRNYHKILMSMLAEVEAIKANFRDSDENTALVGNDARLRALWVSVCWGRQGLKMSHGKVNLEAIYDDGFHICPDF